MTEEREPQGKTTESTERIPPGSMPPDDHSASDPTEKEDEHADDDAKADQESKESFPASDPPSW